MCLCCITTTLSNMLNMFINKRLLNIEITCVTHDGMWRGEKYILKYENYLVKLFKCKNIIEDENKIKITI